MQNTIRFPKWAFMVMAAATGAIGLLASAVTAQFFVLGLERLEPDPLARGILVVAGVLMIITELVAFGVASLLTSEFRGVRNKLVALGLILLVFEAVTICVTQGALDKASEAAQLASAERMNELKVSINVRRETAQSLRANGTTQSASSNAWTRTLGAAALRDALKVEAQIEPLAQELALLQAQVRPTTSTVLGEQGTMIYGIAKGILISAMGLVMFGVAGSLLRAAMTQADPLTTKEEIVTHEKAEQTQHVDLESESPIVLVDAASGANSRDLHRQEKDGCRNMQESDAERAKAGKAQRVVCSPRNRATLQAKKHSRWPGETVVMNAALDLWKRTTGHGKPSSDLA